MQDPKNCHLGTFTNLFGYIFATKARIDNQKQEGQHPLTGQRAPPISGGT